MRVLILALLLSSSCCIELSAQQVWVLDRDGGPGVDFTTMSAAIAAVASGDIVLVRDSAINYGDVTISGKSLHLIAEPEVAGARPRLALVRVTGLAADQVVTFHGFEISPGILVPEPGVWVQHCAGAVVLENVVIAPQVTFGPAAVMSVEGSSRVLVSRSTIAIPSPATGSAVPVHGLSVAGSDVAVYDSTIAGVDGRNAVADLLGEIVSPSVAGGDGLLVDEASSVSLAGCQVSGGGGGEGTLANGTCWPSNDGGAGATVHGRLVRMDSTIVGGATGVDASGCPQVSVAGPDVYLTGGSVTTIADTLRRFQVAVPIHEGTSAVNSIEGVPGDPVVLLVGFAPDVTIFAHLGGALVGAPPFIAAFVGVIPAGGTLGFSVPVPVGSLPPSLAGVVLYEQIAVPGASGFGVLGAPAIVTIVR